MATPAKKPAKKAAKKTATKPAKKAATPTARSRATRTRAVAATRHAANEAAEAAVESAEAAVAAAEAADAVADDDPLLDTAIRQLEAGVTDEKPYGELGEPVGESSPYRIAFVATLGVLTAVLLAQSVVLVRDVLVLIVISAFLAIGLSPAVEWMERRGTKRSLAVAAVIGAVLLFFGGFVAAAVPPVARQASELREEVPRYLERLQEDNGTYRRLDDQFDITAKITKALEENQDAAPGVALSVAKGVLSAIFKTLTVLILTLYFLSAYPRIKRTAYRMVPRSRRARFGLLGDEILSRVGGYVLGNLATSFIAGVCAFIVFTILDVPSPVALAMLVAILDLIPLVGATIAAIICTFVAFFVSTAVGLITGGYFLAYQQVENFVLVPRVMKRTVDVSPLTTIIAALIGGALLGVVGALLAIPAAAAIQLIGSEVLMPRQDQT